MLSQKILNQSLAHQKISNQSTSKNSSSKFLEKISPLPEVSSKQRIKQSVKILTSLENMIKQKEKDKKKTGKSTKNLNKTTRRRNERTPRKLIELKESEIDESEDPKNVDSNNCVECWKNYYTTQYKADWITCSNCKKWLHETCTMYETIYNDCGRKKKRNINFEKQK